MDMGVNYYGAGENFTDLRTWWVRLKAYNL